MLQCTHQNSFVFSLIYDLKYISKIGYFVRQSPVLDFLQFEILGFWNIFSYGECINHYYPVISIRFGGIFLNDHFAWCRNYGDFFLSNCCFFTCRSLMTLEWQIFHFYFQSMKIKKPYTIQQCRSINWL